MGIEARDGLDIRTISPAFTRDSREYWYYVHRVVEGILESMGSCRTQSEWDESVERLSIDYVYLEVQEKRSGLDDSQQMSFEILKDLVSRIFIPLDEVRQELLRHSV